MENYKSNAGQNLGIAALVLGIIAFVLSFIPCINILALIPGIIGIILSIVAINQASRENASKSLIIAALVISILATTFAVVWSVFIVSSVQKGGWLRTQIENAIEEETGTSVDNHIKDFGNEMEKVLEDLENKVDSTSIDIEINKTMSDSEFNEFLTNYEKLINEAINLKEKSKTGDRKSIEAYLQVSVKLNEQLTKLSTSKSRLTSEQAKKLEKLTKKYEENLNTEKE